MIKYRAELDGLRAIAVLSVILFHAGFKRFEGGFVGVDIFFVLSGFLITSIIIKDIEADRFSFASFYERRIRRLLPPLLPVLLITSLLSITFLSDEQLASTAKSVYATLSVVSNWYFLSTVGYFDGPGHTTPLLHTWSLSIEEQFYLFFPITIVVLYRLNIDIKKIITAFLLISFLYSTYLVSTSTTEHAFYNSAGRFWELLVGALLACIKKPAPDRQSHRDCMEVAGLLMILWPILKYEPDMLFPGPSALLPTIGTALIIAAGGKGRYVSRALRIKPLVFIGLISYALYLWHWPLLAFINITLSEPSRAIIVIAIALSFALATLSYFSIEKPIREKRALQSQGAAYKFALSTFIITIGSTAILSSPDANHLREKVSSIAYKAIYGSKALPIKRIEEERTHYLANLNLNYTGSSGAFSLKEHRGYTCSFDNNNTTIKILKCVIGQAKSENVLLIGDSIGRDTMLSLKKAYPNTNFIMLHNSSCPATEFTEGGKVCFDGLKQVLEETFKSINIRGIVINFSYHPLFWERFNYGLPEIIHHGKPVVVLGVTPFFKKSIGDQLKTNWSNDIPQSVSKSETSLLQWNYDEIVEKAKAISATNNVPFIDLSSFYCPKESCSLWIDGDIQEPLFIDTQHISELGMSKLGDFLSQQPEISEIISAPHHIADNQ